MAASRSLDVLDSDDDEQGGPQAPTVVTAPSEPAGTCTCGTTTRLLFQILSRIDTISHDITSIKEDIKRLNKPTVMAERTKINKAGSLVYKANDALY